ncbi:hypothetical protein DM01DRAFT_1331111 [Hesseltinella vesiculosa]|uniref:Uncharacterized protein n=1 Tax=Hesseltinella vesiculosa TaxID=101127 RepID=A0A1X2GY56_9FUNG|nr:hypothetical protein DM01DRAFT_1331111 [Hesseltinella vesiculosa]
MARDPFNFQSYATTRPSSPSEASECLTENNPKVENTGDAGETPASHRPPLSNNADQRDAYHKRTFLY